MATVTVSNKRRYGMAVESLLAFSSPTWERLSMRAMAALASHSIGLLRISLGLVFIWFGLLKVIGLSPAAALVRATLPWLPPQIVVPALGWFEVGLGLTLVMGVGLRLALPLFCAHLAGTFLVLVME